MGAKCRSVLFAMFCVAIGLHPANAQNFDGFKRGVALFHPLISATLQPGSNTKFAFPPFADAKHQLTNAQLAAIKNAGFDFVRLPVDPGPFLQFKGVQRDALDDIMRQRVQMILDAGLNVIVDFHPIPSSVEYGPKQLVQSSDSQLFHDYCDMLTRTARLLNAFHSNRVSLELMNEPQLGGTVSSDAQWQNMEEVAYHAARAGAPTLTVVLAGNMSGEYEGLLALDPTPFVGDSRAIFTFHYYLPYEFTTQSFPRDPQLRVAADVPYPAQSRGIDESMAALKLRLAKTTETDQQKKADTALALATLTQYRASNFNRATIQGHFDKVAAWAAKYGVPPSRIFLGEFGVIRQNGIYDGARDPDRVRWLHDVREVAEAHGFSWSIWAYSGSGGMEIMENDNTDAINVATLRALGLQ